MDLQGIQPTHYTSNSPKDRESELDQRNALFKTKAEFHAKTGDNKECNSNLDYYQSTWNVKCSKKSREVK